MLQSKSVGSNQRESKKNGEINHHTMQRTVLHVHDNHLIVYDSSNKRGAMEKIACMRKWAVIEISVVVARQLLIRHVHVYTRFASSAVLDALLIIV